MGAPQNGGGWQATRWPGAPLLFPCPLSPSGAVSPGRQRQLRRRVRPHVGSSRTRSSRIGGSLPDRRRAPTGAWPTSSAKPATASSSRPPRGRHRASTRAAAPPARTSSGHHRAGRSAGRTPRGAPAWRTARPRGSRTPRRAGATPRPRRTATACARARGGGWRSPTHDVDGSERRAAARRGRALGSSTRASSPNRSRASSSIGGEMSRPMASVDVRSVRRGRAR